MKRYIIIFYLFIFYSSCTTSEDPSVKNVELQSLEIDIYTKIEQGDKSGALDLLKNLTHPSVKEWKEKRKMDDWEHFLNGGNQYYTYNEWWSVRRDSLRNEIGKINNNGKNSSSNKESTSLELYSSSEANMNNEKQIERAAEVPIRYLGLYVFQYENGSTQFYKIFKAENDLYSAIYQDNISGNVRIENYIVQTFDEITGEIKLQSKKDKRSITELKFLIDSESNNGFKLIDIQGLTYSYVL